MCNDCPLKYDMCYLQEIARERRDKKFKEYWIVRVIKNIKYKIWFNRNWK
jgi:hypothetical protein